jgi:hypothetical protein
MARRHRATAGHSLALADEMRGGIAEYQRRLDEQGIVQRRVWIVELPLSDYLQWELHVLRIRADLGERIRVLPPSAGRASPSPTG